MFRENMPVTNECALSILSSSTDILDPLQAHWFVDKLTFHEMPSWCMTAQKSCQMSARAAAK